MVKVLISRNLFRSSEREVVDLNHGGGNREIRSFMPKDLRGRPDVIAYRNSIRADLDERVWPLDSVAFLVRPRGPVLPFLGQLLITAAVSFIASKLFPPPRLSGPKQRDDTASSTYSFEGISNNRSEGQSIAIVYGEMRFGGTVIGEYVTAVTLFPIQTDLHMLFCFGEGPIFSVGGVEVDTPAGQPLGSANGGVLPSGIKVNDNLSDNYEGIEAEVRLGTQEQTVIPSFEDARQAFSVDQKLSTTEVTVVDTNTYALDESNPYDSTNDGFWDAFGVAFDLNVEDVDEFIIRVSFPNGYFRQDLATGGLIAAWFGMQVRYQELDGGGVPITTGGPNGDGFVRLPIVANMPWTKRGPFEWEFRQPFFDKDTYSDPVLGRCADTGTVGRIGAAIDMYPFAGNGSIDEFSISFWTLLDVLDTPALGTFHHLIGDYVDSNNRGFSVGLQYRQFPNFGFGGTDAWQWVVEFGDGSQRQLAEPPLTQTPIYTGEEDVWYHVVYTYKRANDGAGSKSSHRLYINNVRVLDFAIRDSDRMRASAENLRINNNPNGTLPSRFSNIQTDDVHFYSRRINSAIVSQLWNGGAGTNALIRGDICVANYDWDDAVSGIVNNADPDQGGQWYGDMAIEAGGPTIGTIDGRVSTQAANEIKKGQYRVEAVRANVESTAASVTNVARFDVITSIIDVQLSYPNVALCGLKIPATDQLNTSIPKVTFLVRGRFVPIWDGLSELNPALTPTWSQNPAWIALDMILHKRYGLGQFYGPTDVVLPDLLAWANYCDATVYDGGLQQILLGTGTTDDVTFDATTVDPLTSIVRGSLEFFIDPLNLPPGGDASARLPSDWVVGHRIYLTGFPDSTHSSGNIFNDINSDTGAPPDFAGYEIFEVARVTSGAQQWIVKVYWDRLAEADPWGSAPFPDSLSVEILPDDYDDFSMTVAGGQARFEFNGVFDSHRRAWDALLEICAVGRAVPIREGRRLRFKFNSPRDHVGVVGLGSILEGSFEIGYGGLAHRSNVIEVTILDEDREYEQITVEARADDLNPANVAEIRKETQVLFGVTNRHQAERQARFQVLINEYLVRQGKFKTAANGMQYEPGDVVRLGHDVIPRGVSGRAFSTSTQGDRFTIDRDLTILAATTYNVYAHNLADSIGSAVIDTSVTVPGDYNPGDEIRLVASIGFALRQDDVYIIVIDGDELEVEIVNSKGSADLSHEFEFVEYNEIIYSDESQTPQSSQSGTGGGDPLVGVGKESGGPTTELSIPARVRTLTVTDRFIRTGPGQFILVVHASWQMEAEDRPFVTRAEIWMREVDDQTVAFPIIGEAPFPTADRTRSSSSWRKIASVAGFEEFAEVQIPQALVAREIEIAVCPIKQSGAKRRIQTCESRIREIGGFGPHPAAPTGLTADMRAQKAVYSWDAIYGQEDAFMEIRRTSYENPVVAGWILAPVVYRGVVADTESPPMRDWAGSTTTAATRLLARTINSIGHKSDLSVAAWEPAPELDNWDTSVDLDDLPWHTNSGGNRWYPVSPTTSSAIVINLVQSGTAPDHFLEFTGSFLIGQWTAAFDGLSLVGLDQFRTPREYFIEAVLVAEQVHPFDLSHDVALGDPEFTRWTLEGPTHLRPGEDECTIRIHARFNINGLSTGWSEWQIFRPGLYTCVNVQFRLEVTRPSSSYQVKIHRLDTRVTPPRQGLESNPPFSALLTREFFS